MNVGMGTADSLSRRVECSCSDALPKVEIPKTWVKASEFSSTATTLHARSVRGAVRTLVSVVRDDLHHVKDCHALTANSSYDT